MFCRQTEQLNFYQICPSQKASFLRERGRCLFAYMESVPSNAGSGGPKAENGTIITNQF